MAKKQNSLVESQNSMVNDLRSGNWLYNPVVYSQISGDFSLMQQRIMIGVVQRLQKKIIDSVAEQHKSKSFPAIFDESELMNRDVIELEFSGEELGVLPEHYSQLEDAATALGGITMKYPQYDSQNRVSKYVAASLFPRIEMTKPNIRRSGNIVIKMLTENIRDIFTMQYGYVTHLSHIASISKKKRTPRLYIYLSRFRDIGHKRVPYKDLVEFLGLTDEYYEKNNSGANPYTSWSKVKSLVLEQVKKEMKEMADNGEIDFWFDYSPIFANGKTRGIPAYVDFIITKSSLGLLRDENNERIVQEQRIVSGIIDKYPTLSFRTIGNLCSDLADEDLCAFEEFVVKQLPQIVGNKMPRNPAGYVMGILNKWHTERKSKQQTLAFDTLAGDLSGLVHDSMPKAENALPFPNDGVGEEPSATVPEGSPEGSQYAPDTADRCQQLMNELRLTYGAGQMGYEYYFGRRAHCYVSQAGTVVIALPSFGYEKLNGSPNETSRIRRCVEIVFGTATKFMLTYF